MNTVRKDKVVFETTLEFSNLDAMMEVFGPNDAHVRRIEKEFDVVIFSRDGLLHLSGEKDNVEKAIRVLRYLEKFVTLSGYLTEQNVEYAISLSREGDEMNAEKLLGGTICITAKGRTIKPKTIG